MSGAAFWLVTVLAAGYVGWAWVRLWETIEIALGETRRKNGGD